MQIQIFSKKVWVISSFKESAWSFKTSTGILYDERLLFKLRVTMSFKTSVSFTVFMGKYLFRSKKLIADINFPKLLDT